MNRYIIISWILICLSILIIYNIKNFSQEANSITSSVEKSKNISDKTNSDTSKIKEEDYRKVVVLTFDDGPDPVNTVKLLDILKENNISATFFLVGKSAEKYPEAVKEIFKDGHEIGNHTFDHKDLKTLSSKDIKNEIDKTDRIIQNLIGRTPKYIRPPYGSVDKEIANIINRPIINWSVDSEDWKSQNTDMIIQHVLQTVYDGSIILFHDTHKETIKAIPYIIRDLIKNGYKIITLNELLNSPNNNEIYYGKNDHRAADN
ncbi:polysaccharide deacetylase family protein [Enterococcus sp. DIV2381]